MDKFDKFISVLEESLETYRSSDPSIALQKAIDATKDEDDKCFGPSPSPIELFVGARCVLRSGDTVTITRGDGSNVYPFLAVTNSGACESFQKNGKYRTGAANDPQDIIRILNPQDRPSPIKYRQVNQFDVDKECEYFNEDSSAWKPCILKAIYKTPAPAGSRISAYDPSSEEEWVLQDDYVRIIAKDDDPVVKTLYVNAYVTGVASGCHGDVVSADKYAASNRTARIKVQYVDGQYDA